ncbi:MAG TPA: hypothetical protein VMW87_13255 [Spirochaetia bacterium]|nr:hypothetical protein [Spirochaetia bacterium]
MNERLTLADRLDQHRAFWQRRPQERPLAAFRIGDFFFSRHFEAAHPLLVPKAHVYPEMIAVDAYIHDYERMFAESESLQQDGFWTAEPFTGIPWMEAILGCDIIGAEASFSTTHPYNSAAEATDAIEALLAGGDDSAEPPNRWLDLYLEFTRMLVSISGGRFPVAQPIMRGPTDMVAALLGQQDMVYALIDDPQTMHRLVEAVTSVFLRTISLQQALVPTFEGGSSLGFYHVWAPGRSIWFQDDLSALLSPDLYREFFLPAARSICSAYEYTAVHLHSSSFHVLDDLLSLPELKSVEVNKDIGGPSIAEMMPVFEKVLQKKALIIWGDLTPEELAQIESRLPARGLFLHIVVPTMEEAAELNAHIQSWEQ